MNSAYNQMPLDKPSERLTNFVIAEQQCCFKPLFYGISIGPTAFSCFMSSIFRPVIRKKKVISYLDDVFIQYNRHNVANSQTISQNSQKQKP